MCKEAEDDDNLSVASTEPGDPEAAEAHPCENEPSLSAAAPPVPPSEPAAPALPATVPSTEPAGSKPETGSAEDGAPVRCLTYNKLD